MAERTEQPVMILGTRTFAEDVADLIDDTPGYQVAGFVENMDRDRCRDTLVGHRIYWIDEIAQFAKTHLAVCALSTTHRSRFIEMAAERGMRFATIVHPTARISGKSTLGEGSIISVGSIVAAHTQIGRHVILNRGALIGHHTRVGDFVSVQPGANIAGACDIGQATYIGMGAIVLDKLKVGKHCVIAAGSVVTKDVPDNVLVMGVPAKIVKENIEGK